MNVQSMVLSSVVLPKSSAWSVESRPKQQQHHQVKNKVKLKRPNDMDGRAVLKCVEPGCIATAKVFLNKDTVVNSTCTLKVNVNQTDYDQDYATDEQVEWIMADNTTVKKNCTPGKNPCTKQDAAREVLPPFPCVEDQDVTEAARDGEVMVRAKISQMVDECDYNGFLFYGIAEVVCVPQNNNNATVAAPTPAPTPAAGSANGTAAAGGANQAKKRKRGQHKQFLRAHRRDCLMNGLC